ncbi:alpha-amylase family glycosyl hydrolase [Chloroflexota bacterium]
MYTDFKVLVEKLREHNMGLLLDIVPNHMAADPENPWWQDVLKKGQESSYAAFFDLDWLAFEQIKNTTTGYRRFFDIGDLVGVRVEDSAVFKTTHSLILRLVAEGKVTGLRIDHIDGPLQSTPVVNGTNSQETIIVSNLLQSSQFTDRQTHYLPSLSKYS